MAKENAFIEVRIRELTQLFNSFDPSPFQERDLDSDAEEYIVGWAREFPWDASLRIIVQLPEEEARKARERGLSAELANYFPQCNSANSTKFFVSVEAIYSSASSCWLCVSLAIKWRARIWVPDRWRALLPKV